MLRFKPCWKGVEVVRCLDAARCKIGVSAASKSSDSSFATGVEANDVGEIVTEGFLIGELWRAPDGLLTLLDVSREDGRDADVTRAGMGLAREELGALESLFC